MDAFERQQSVTKITLLSFRIQDLKDCCNFPFTDVFSVLHCSVITSKILLGKICSGNSIK